MADRRIPVCEPLLKGNEAAYVDEAVRTGWISSGGKYIRLFEEAFASYCGVKYAVAVCNGTVALHLCLRSLGIGAGDEVILPSFTMIASAFAVCYVGALPVFVDADAATWNIDVSRIEERITPRTRAIMAVHLFGNVCAMEQIRGIATRHGIAVIEDAAEAHGAEYHGRKTGGLGDVAAFSFYANKNITTGEGGMVLTDSEDLYRRAAYYKNLCFPLDGPRDYLHDEIGFNYRMSNLHAAIGLAQTERADEYRRLRINNHRLYGERLGGVEGIVFQGDEPGCLNVHWMNAILIDPGRFGTDRDSVMAGLRSRGVDSRLLFVGMHRQKSLREYGCDVSGEYPVTDGLSARGFYLPSGSGLTEDDIDYVCDAVLESRGC
jgi:perosamine synthetase